MNLSLYNTNKRSSAYDNSIYQEIFCSNDPLNTGAPKYVTDSKSQIHRKGNFHCSD